MSTMEEETGSVVHLKEKSGVSVDISEKFGQQRIVVCLFAHNEEKSIQRTVLALINGNPDLSLCIKVYLNGCTDRSVEIVEELACQWEGVEPVVIAEASKVKAWNRAFHENREEILFFGDGDVLTEAGVVAEILQVLKEREEVKLVGCPISPISSGLRWQQRLVGLLQIPLRQDFLTGSFYGLRRHCFAGYFGMLGLNGIPQGIVGEDAFLDRLISRRNFYLVKSRVFYEPPVFVDYIPYLARLRWQNEQIDSFFHKVQSKEFQREERGGLRKIVEKIRHGKPRQLVLGGSMAILKTLFKWVFASRINAAYQKLGPVVDDGSWVLSKATRSESVK